MTLFVKNQFTNENGSSFFFSIQTLYPINVKRLPSHGASSSFSSFPFFLVSLYPRNVAQIKLLALGIITETALATDDALLNLYAEQLVKF